MKILVGIARVIVGVLFIFSGLVKANDPLGLSYKMQEFFEVWHFHWLDNYTLIFSIVMIVFEIVAGAVLPAQKPEVPILIGGKSEATVRRTVEHGDGWLAMFVSARKFAEFVGQITERAAAVDRPVPVRHGFEVWCGLADDASVARELVAEKMQALYKLPFDKFERLCPAGTPKQVADFLRPYVEAGAQSLTLVPCSPSWQAGVDAVAEVRALLTAG